jgi:nucleoside diphosphate kinase
MNNNVSFLLLSPEALRRGWTGWVLAGACARTSLDLAWAGVFDASPAAAALGLAPDRGSWGVLVFRGESAPAKLAAAVGAPGLPGSLAGMLGPGMVAAPAEGAVAASLLAQLAGAQAAEKPALESPVADGSERSLVLVKPDNFRSPGTRAGAVVDVFARTGLPLIAMKVHHMSVAEGMDFYGPVLDALVGKFGPEPGRDHWENIVEFMSGFRPSQVPEPDHGRPGTQKILALVFEGPGAIAKIRAVLGPTDPAKAPPGTIRGEFGTSIMVNAAHASDAPENAAREIGIVKVAANPLKGFVESSASAA